MAPAAGLGGNFAQGAGGLAAPGIHSDDARNALQQLMQANGLRQEDLQNPERVTHIEMVLDDYCCMQTLNMFPNLRYVCLIQQAIAKMEGLQACTQLERLLLNENRIQKLEGLSECRNLKQLCICTNEIDTIGTGLVGLVKLESLWLADNRISVMDGLDQVPALTELNIARNRITTTRAAFDSNPHLRSVNLADNRISSHWEVLDLARYGQLRELCFSDPDWGENPICQLCNYTTYILFHLPQLDVHDRVRIGDEEQEAAQSAFFKKALYYNMRIKLVKRQAADALRKARQLHEDRASMLRREVEAVSRVLRRYESASAARKLNPPGTQPSAEEAGEGQDLAPMQKQLRESRAELHDVTATWNALETGVHSEVMEVTREMQMELQTGGNLRTEEGHPSKEAWAKQITELVSSRFRSEELAAFGIADISVTSVIRVHNRSLRIRFEEVLDAADVDTTSQFEYLFYVPDPSCAAADIRRVAQFGFAPDTRRAASTDGNARGTSSRSAELGGSKPSDEHPRLLTNSVGVAEACRLRRAVPSPWGHAVSQALQRALRMESPGAAAAGRLPAQPPVICSGQLLVCSTCIPSQSPDIPSCFDSPEFDVREQWRREPSGTVLEAAEFGVPADASTKLLADASPAESEGLWRTVYRTSADDPRQKVWHTSNPDAVLPEFVVEFDYVFSSPLIQAHLAKHQLHPPSGVIGSMFRAYGLCASLGMPSSASVEDEAPGEKRKPSKERDLKDKFVARDDGPELSAAQTMVIQLPDLPDPPQIVHLESGHILKRDIHMFCTTDENVLKHLKVLNLHARGIRRIDASVFEVLPMLRVLILSFNAIENISWLPSSTSVVHLDVSFNFLQTVHTLKALPALKHLDMGWNSLFSLEVASVIARDLPEIENLLLQGNPLATGKDYTATILGHVPRLKVLDDRELQQAEVEEARSKMTTQSVLTNQVLMDHAYVSLRRRGGVSAQEPSREPGPGLGRYAPTALTATADMRANCCISTLLKDPASGVSQENWKALIEAVDISRLGLCSLGDVGGLPSLRELCLDGNEVASLSQLSSARTLEALSAESNGLTSLEGLSSLTNLQRVDLAMNRLTSVLELSKLPKLSQLSLEDNYIDSLDTFPMLRGLMELYLSNNLIEELRSVLMLKQLPKLIVLDLSGNELCQSPDYRRYTIFHLRRLKVLDGLLVTAAECQDAEDKFSGKVTLELLEEKLGPTPACYSFRSVDLSGQGLRDLGNLLNDDMFPSLRELCLDGNPFTSLKTLGPLGKLLVLRLNRTKIDLEKGVLGEGPGCGGFGSLRHLQVLEMATCGIADMSHLAKASLTALRILHLQGNDIARLEGISHMEQLRELVLDRNKIKQFDESSFVGLRSLRELRLEDNGLKSLEHLGPLPRLHALHLSANRIAEVSELEHMRNLRHLVIVHLAQNPVSRKPLYRACMICSIRTLRAIDGKEVTDEERERSDLMLSSADPSKNSNVMGQGVYVFTDASQVSVQNSGIAFVGSGIVGDTQLVSRAPGGPSVGHRGNVNPGQMPRNR